MKINDCIVDGDKVDAVGLFKSELHDTVLKVVNNSNGIQITPENGMSLKKLDKGCVVFNKTVMTATLLLYWIAILMMLIIGRMLSYMLYLARIVITTQ